MSNVGDNWKCPYCGHAQVARGRRPKLRFQNISGLSQGPATGSVVG
jgi:rubredoxin